MFPIKRLAFQQPIETKDRGRYVYTWDQLVSAIGDYVKGLSSTDFAAGNLAAVGGTIIFGSSFTWKGTITIPTACAGLTIDGAGFYITTNTADMDMFVFDGDNKVISMTFQNIRAYGDDVKLPAWGTMFTITHAEDVRIYDCHVSGEQLLLCNGLNTGIVSGCTTEDFGAGTWLQCLNATGVRILANNLDSSSTNGINLSTGSRACTVVANTMTSNGIITTGGLGSNTVVANAQAGTITSLGSDQVGLNT